MNTKQRRFVIFGRVLEQGTGKGLKNIIVEALDKDRCYDDRLGAVITDAEGKFEIIYDKEDFQKSYCEEKPDIYLRIRMSTGKVICTSKNKIRYNADNVEEFTFRIPRSIIMPSEKDPDKLTVIPLANNPEVRPGPYKIEIFKGHKITKGKPFKVKKNAVLGSPAEFIVPPGKYRINVSNYQEGEFVQITSVSKNKETIVAVKIGRQLSRSYGNLMLEMKDNTKGFETFMGNIAKDIGLRKDFFNNPNKVLQKAGLLKKGSHLSRKNRLFISLLTDEDFLSIIRQGPQRMEIPQEYQKIHSLKIKTFAQKILPPHVHLSPEVVQQSVQGRYYLERLLKSTLNNPVIEKIYKVKLEPNYVSNLFDKAYEIAANPKIQEIINIPDNIPDESIISRDIVLLKQMVSVNNMVNPVVTATVSGMGIYVILTKASQDLGVFLGVGVTDEAAIVLDSYIFTEDTIFVKSKVLCKGVPDPIQLSDVAGVYDNFDYFDEYTVTDDFGNLFDIDSIKVNELYNVSMIADAFIEGMNYMDYESTMNYAQNTNLNPNIYDIL